MSVKMTVAQQSDGLDKLFALVSVKKEDVIAAHEEARKQMQLTEAEQAKVAEAKNYIAKHTFLAADLQRREDELTAAKQEHLSNVKNFSTHVETENNRLETFAAALTTRETQIIASEQRNKKEAERLAAERLDFERQQRDAANANTAVINANNAAKTANEKETQRLKDLADSLKLKAQKIREQAASF